MISSIFITISFIYSTFGLLLICFKDSLHLKSAGMLIMLISPLFISMSSLNSSHSSSVERLILSLFISVLAGILMTFIKEAGSGD